MCTMRHCMQDSSRAVCWKAEVLLRLLEEVHAGHAVSDLAGSLSSSGGVLEMALNHAQLLSGFGIDGSPDLVRPRGAMLAAVSLAATMLASCRSTAAVAPHI